MIEKIEENRNKESSKEEAEISQIPLVIIYNQHSKKIKKVLKARQSILNSAFHKTRVKPRLVYRRQNNLNDLFIQKGLRGPIEQGDKELNTFTYYEEILTYKNKCLSKGKTHMELVVNGYFRKM